MENKKLISTSKREYNEKGQFVKEEATTANGKLTIRKVEYHDNGNESCLMILSDGYNSVQEYDTDGRTLHFLKNDRDETSEHIKTYDEKGNLLTFKRLKNGILIMDNEFKYDDTGRQIYKKGFGIEISTEYTDTKIFVRGFLISEGFKTIVDDVHNLNIDGTIQSIYEKNNKHLMEYLYDDKGNNIKQTNINTKTSEIIEEIEKEYDENGNVIHEKQKVSGREVWREYNKDNKLLSYKDNKGKNRKYEYDENGKKIYTKNEYMHYRVERDEQGNITKRIDYKTIPETVYIYENKYNDKNQLEEVKQYILE